MYSRNKGVVMKHYKTVSWTVSVSISCLLVFALYRFARQLFVPTSISYSFDYQFSEDTKKQLATLIKQEVAPYCAAALKNSIKNTVPALKSLALRFNPRYNMHVKLHAQQPIITVVSSSSNNRYALVGDGTVIEQRHFAGDVMEQLPSITVDQNSWENTLYEPEMAEFIKNMPQNFYDDYGITWVNKTYIMLENKQNKDILVALHTTRFDDTLMTYLEQIKQVIQEKKALKSTKRTQKNIWKADLRFRDQIVLSQTNCRGNV